MNRRAFCITGSMAGVGLCLGGLTGCSAPYFAQTTASAEKITVPKSEFQYLKKEKVQGRQYVFLRRVGSELPICLYKNTTGYTACLMECTHKGCEVEVHGPRFVCPCHGSEFTTEGAVLEGPAERPLKTFKTTEDESNIYVWLA